MIKSCASRSLAGILNTGRANSSCPSRPSLRNTVLKTPICIGMFDELCSNFVSGISAWWQHWIKYEIPNVWRIHCGDRRNRINDVANVVVGLDSPGADRGVRFHMSTPKRFSLPIPDCRPPLIRCSESRISSVSVAYLVSLFDSETN